MHLKRVLRVIGILLMLFSVVHLCPIPFAWFFNEDTIDAFLGSAFITFTMGGVMFLLGEATGDLRTRDGFLLTVLFYFGIGIFGALPFYL